MNNVLILSGASVDSIIYLDEFPQAIPQTIHKSIFAEKVGSTGNGKAANLGYLDFKTTLHVLLGDDLQGKMIMDFFKDKPVEFLYDYDKSGTQRHVNIMNKRGERISIFVNTTSDEPDFDYNSLESNIKHADIVVLNIFNYARNFIPLLVIHNKEVWTDLHDYDEGNPYHEDFIDAAQYIHLSSDNLSDYKSTMHKLMERGKELVICTHAKKGASVLSKDGEFIEEPIISSYILQDANGAGDSFFSGFLYAYKKGKSLRECLRYGHVMGGLCITSDSIAPNNLSTAFVEEEYKKYFST
jgi:sugar/nucleoside kinase (ribokinase family)